MAYEIGRFFLLSYCLTCCWPGLEASDPDLVRGWVSLEFRFPSEEAKQLALCRGDYIPGASVPLDADKQDIDGENSRIFITIPRFSNGRPITLGVVGDDGIISPYPDYSWNDRQGYNCDGFTSVYRIAIDQCNRLWVMDTGKFLDVNQVCPPQLLAFDLSTDELIYRFKVKPSNYKANSLFVTPVIDVRDDCDNTFIYIADITGFSLLVVDMANDRSWLISHRYFYPNPDYGDLYINGYNVNLMDGVIGMALSPYKSGEDRTLYFHATASITENYVLTSVLRNDSFINNVNAEPHAIGILPGTRQNQSTPEAIDNNGVMFFGIMDPPSLWCWNTASEFSTSNFYQITLDRGTMQFPGGMKIVNNINGEQELWIVTTHFKRVWTKTLSTNEINFWIHAGKVSDLLEGSACGPPLKGYVASEAPQAC